VTTGNTVAGGYPGMQWFRCDLQVQTPEDAAHWQDDDLRLGSPRRPKVGGRPDDDGIQEKARAYLRRCHELGLDVLGVTDHNSSDCSDPRDRFLTHLVQQNQSEQALPITGVDADRRVDREPRVLPGEHVAHGVFIQEAGSGLGASIGYGMSATGPECTCPAQELAPASSGAVVVVGLPLLRLEF